MDFVSPRDRAFARVLGIAVVAVSLALPVAARDLPAIDALRSAPALAQPQRITAAMAPAIGGPTAIQVHSRLGVPTFLWGQYVPAAAAVGKTAGITASTDAASAARLYLQGLGNLYTLSVAQAAAANVAYTQDLPNGGVIVKLRNRVDGIEVFREEAGVVLDADRNLVAIGGFLIDRAPVAPYALGATDAAARALADWSFGAGTAAQLQYGVQRDGYLYLSLPAGVTSSDGSRLNAPVRTKRVLYRMPGQLIPAYYIEARVHDGAAGASTDGAVTTSERGQGHAGGSDDTYSYVVSGVDGRILWRKNLTVDATYRVYAETTGGLPFPGPTGRNGYPHPTGTPDGYIAPFVTQNVVSLENLPFSRNDPWLPPGGLTTVGNNVDAYVDRFAPNNFGPVDPAECNAAVPPFAGDFHACTTGTRAPFGQIFDPTKAPGDSKTQIMSSVVNLFYVNNYLHDWFYDAGFDEASGNAQNDNFGRGGLGLDSIMAEAQDFSGLFNANMTTPSDGGRPQMQMYPFFQDSLLEVNAPPALAGAIAFTGGTQFGPQQFDFSSAVAYATPANGCTPITGVTGKIAFIDRGVCTFTAKVLNAQAAGAIGVILANNQAGNQLFYVLGLDPTITIPTATISQNNGNVIRGQLLLPATVNIRIASRQWRDGTMDNAIVAHEWGHYLSNRLIGDANGIGSNMSAGMGEGWSDFISMLLLVKDSDRLLAANANFTGAYTVGLYALDAPNLAPLPFGENQSSYYGIRRYPYSRDMNKNPLTFKHIEDGVPLPLSPPPAFGASGASNAEVHNAGEVWATMLWDCYSNLLNDRPRLTFAQAQDRMKRYLVAGLKLTPVDPTFTEARDAMLAAMLSQDAQDYAKCYAGFATRGAGFGAVSPDRYSNDNANVVESFAIGGNIAVTSVQVTESTVRCVLNDGILDNGDAGVLTISFRNTGTIALAATSIHVSSDNPHLTFPAGTSFNVPPTNPGQTVSVFVPVAVSGAVGIEYASVTIQISDPGLASGPISQVSNLLLNANQVPSATDDVENNTTAWVVGASIPVDPSWTWRRIEVAAGDHRWLGPDTSVPKLSWLQSPPLNVAATGSFSFTFRHRFAFEGDGVDNYDGGQIQLSTNGGTSWSDIGASASPGYNGTVLLYGGGNPLEGLPAFVFNSPAYPALNTVTVSLGTAYQGQTVLVRFALGADAAVGAPGWEIDDIAFANITNTPFTVVGPHAPISTCGGPIRGR